MSLAKSNRLFISVDIFPLYGFLVPDMKSEIAQNIEIIDSFDIFHMDG